MAARTVDALVVVQKVVVQAAMATVVGQMADALAVQMVVVEVAMVTVNLEARRAVSAE